MAVQGRHGTWFNVTSHSRCNRHTSALCRCDFEEPQGITIQVSIIAVSEHHIPTFGGSYPASKRCPVSFLGNINHTTAQCSSDSSGLILAAIVSYEDFETITHRCQCIPNGCDANFQSRLFVQAWKHEREFPRIRSPLLVFFSHY